MNIKNRLTLSAHSQSLIKAYRDSCRPQSSVLERFSSSAEMSQVINWLNESTHKLVIAAKSNVQKKQFLLAALRAELLKDLNRVMPQSIIEPQNKEKKNTKSAKTKLILLAIAGTLLGIFEGFDCTVTVMGTFSLPSIAIILAGVALSGISLVIFYGLTLSQIGKSLDISMKDTPKILDHYSSQMQEIKALRKKINNYNLSELSITELMQFEQMLIMLTHRFIQLKEVGGQFDAAINAKGMTIAKSVFAIAAGLLFFGGGFGAGQSVAYFVAGLFMTTVSATFWPVILVSCLVGILAFAIHWQLEHSELKKIISNWVGLSEDKIAQISDKTILDKEENKLLNLKNKICSSLQLALRMHDLEQQVKAQPETEKHSRALVNAKAHSVATNIHSFHAPIPSPEKRSSAAKCHHQSDTQARHPEDVFLDEACPECNIA